MSCQRCHEALPPEYPPEKTKAICGHCWQKWEFKETTDKAYPGEGKRAAWFQVNIFSDEEEHSAIDS